jgi:hypothetical protein
VIHLDNCSIYTSQASTYWFEERVMHRMIHSPYLPDLAPSYFYLFPTVKEKLERMQMIDEDEFLSPARDFEAHRSKRIEWRISGLCAASSRSKSRQDNGDYVR